MTTRLRKTAQALIDWAKPLLRTSGRPIRHRSFGGRPYPEIIKAVYAAVKAGDEPIMEAIDQQCVDLDGRPRRKLPLGGEVPNIHGFDQWIAWLHHGMSDLPDQLPTAWLEAWRDSYQENPLAKYSNDPSNYPPHCATPNKRCANCKLAMPQRPFSADGCYFTACPACGETRFEHPEWHLDWKNIPPEECGETQLNSLRLTDMPAAEGAAVQ